MDNDVSIQHIDTCFPDFLTDHHNRDGELLLGVEVSASMSAAEVMDELYDEWQGSSVQMPDEAANALTYELDAMVDDARRNPRLFSTDVPEDGQDLPTAWFLFRWQ